VIGAVKPAREKKAFFMPEINYLLLIDFSKEFNLKGETEMVRF
jgi:hypothetical protein